MKRGGGNSQLGRHEIGLPTLLFGFLGAATSWTVHFLVAYFVVGLVCTTTRSEAAADAVIYASTLLFAGVSVLSGWVAYRGWRRLGPEGADLRDAATAVVGGPSRLLLLLGVAGAVVFTPFIVLEGLAPLFVPICAPAAGGGAP